MMPSLFFSQRFSATSAVKFFFDCGISLRGDVGLSVFASTDERFAEYETQIRAEYSIIDPEVFRSKRREILQDFLNRPRIYFTDHFHRMSEQRARKNIQSAFESFER